MAWFITCRFLDWWFYTFALHLCITWSKPHVFFFAPSHSALVARLNNLFSRTKALWLPGPTLLGRPAKYLPSVVIHTYFCQSSPPLGGFIKLFLSNTYSTVYEWSSSKHSLLHFITSVSIAGVVAIWPCLSSNSGKKQQPEQRFRGWALEGNIPELEVPPTEEKLEECWKSRLTA